jgi:hypothetical protein
MNRISTLVLDAINALELKPYKIENVSKQDILRIADLIGRELSEQDTKDCLDYLEKKNAVNENFKNKYLVNWFCRRFGEKNYESPLTFRSVESTPQRHVVSMQKPVKVPKNRTNNPIKDACNNLTDYLDSLGEATVANPDDPVIKKLVQDVLAQFEKRPKAKDALQKAYELVEETYRNEQAKKGEASANVSKDRLKKTKEHRLEKLQKDIDFMMKNQSSSNSGSAMYFLLNPSWSSKSPQPPSLLKPSHNKRLKELLQNPII